jgi:hypothetical protein
MSDAIRWDLVGDRGYLLRKTITRVGVNYTGWTFSAQFRLYPDATGSPIVSLGSVSDDSEGIKIEYAGVDTVANHILAGNLTPAIYALTNAATAALYAPTDSVAVSRLRVTVGATAMSSPNMPAPQAPNEAGDPVVLAWDMQGDDGGGPEPLQKLFFGSVTVRPSVTR